jgi:prevent-host-death family protein
MKSASIAELKARLSSYIKESQAGPVVVTRNGKPVAVLLAVTDEEGLERLVLAHSPKFQAVLEKSNRQIEETGGTPHDAFWRELEAEGREETGKGNRGQRLAKQ